MPDHPQTPKSQAENSFDNHTEDILAHKDPEAEIMADALSSDHAAENTKPSEAASTGYVTALDTRDLHIIRNAMNTTAPPITAAGVFPPNEIIRRFCDYFPPRTPLSFIITRL